MKKVTYYTKTDKVILFWNFSNKAHLSEHLNMITDKMYLYYTIQEVQ